jgi:lipopolysaccharide biosynthesis regulator YciM
LLHLFISAIFLRFSWFSGDIQALQGKFGDAARSFSRVCGSGRITDDAYVYELLLKTASCYMKAKMFAEAMPFLRDAVKAQTTVRVLLALADCYKGLGDDKQQMFMLDAAEQVLPLLLLFFDQNRSKLAMF